MSDVRQAAELLQQVRDLGRYRMAPPVTSIRRHRDGRPMLAVSVMRHCRACRPGYDRCSAKRRKEVIFTIFITISIVIAIMIATSVILT